MSLGFVLAILISGFITGGLARFALPGPDPMPVWLTIAIGLTGSIVGAVIGREALHSDSISGVLAFVVAIALVAAYRRFVQHRPIFGPGAMAFPKTGLGVEQQREKLRQLGIDPDAMRRDPKTLKYAQHEAMLRELHQSGVLTDDELAEKLDRLRTES